MVCILYPLSSPFLIQDWSHDTREIFIDLIRCSGRHCRSEQLYSVSTKNHTFCFLWRFNKVLITILRLDVNKIEHFNCQKLYIPIAGFDFLWTHCIDRLIHKYTPKNGLPDEMTSFCQATWQMFETAIQNSGYTSQYHNQRQVRNVQIFRKNQELSKLRQFYWNENNIILFFKNKHKFFRLLSIIRAYKIL